VPNKHPLSIMATTPGYKQGAFLPKWFGRFGNNVQQISNALYYCKKYSIHFDMAPHPMIEDIDLPFGEKRMPGNENQWSYFYFMEGEECNFPDEDLRVLNFQRKDLCERYILPKLKIDHSKIEEPFDGLVIHLRGGDVFSNPHPHYVQNPLSYYLELLRIPKYQNNTIIVAEDNTHPLIPAFTKLMVPILYLPEADSLEVLLTAESLATSGVGSYAIAAALCSRNIKKLYCTNIWLDESLTPVMLKDHLDVLCMDIDPYKYIKKGDWKITNESITKLLTYTENKSFRRL
jgi:hypothetical protein